MRPERRWLIEAIRSDLLPALVQQGYETAMLPKGGVVDRELIVNSPFGRQRRLGRRGLNMVEVQLASYGRAAFRISFGAVPMEGLDTFAGHVDAKDVLPGWLNLYYELYRSPRLWAFSSLSYFSVRRSFFRKQTKADYVALVSQVANLIPEMELALSDDICGPHVRRVMIDHPRPER